MQECSLHWEPMPDDFLRREIEVGSFPGASYAIGTSAGILRAGAHGLAVAVPARIPATIDTIYDCASITKPLVTTVLVLQAVAEGRFALDDAYRGFTYRELLTHMSGLRAWLPLYAGNDDLRTILEEGPEYERGTRMVYSDLNFILLYFALTEMYGDFVQLARTKIFEPLGLGDAMFNPPPSLRPRTAATEWGQRFEVVKLAKRAFIDGARQGLMWGEVNDGNSFHMGGTAGNAGLFATVGAIFRLAQAWMRAELLPRELVAEATRDQTPGLNERRGLGWLLPPEGGYGHTGFTGTSVWIDPGRDRICVLLTNRVHPCAAPVAMPRIRAEFQRLSLL